jgi:hypothetical protein
MSWETISPDLTTDNAEQQGLPGGPLQVDHTGVEVYNTIFVLEESPTDAAELWVGTDDGRVHLTRDGGGTWTEITPDDMPDQGTVNSIDLSRDTPGRAVMAVYRYRDGDFRPYVFLTEDYGEDWELLTDGENGIPANHPVRVVREDPDRQGLFYAGTEFGMYVSFDEGQHWQPFQANLPVTPITDLAVHRQDLVVATQGRSFWILDDVTPLHTLTDDLRARSLHLFQPREATVARFGATGGARAPEDAPNGVVLHYWVGEEVEGEVEIEILDDTGTVIRDFEGEVEGGDEDSGEEEEGAGEEEGSEEEGGDEDESDDEPEDANLEEEDLDVSPGMNRFVWDLRYPGPDVIEGSRFSLAYTGGMWAPPARYTLRVEAGDEEMEVPVTVGPDPRRPEVSDGDLRAHFELTRRVRDRLTEVHAAIREIRSIRDQTESFVELAEETDRPESVVESLEERAEALDEALTEIEEELIQTKSESGQDPINFPPRLDDQLAYLYSHVTNSYGRPTEGAQERYRDLVAETQPLLDRLDGLVADEVAAFNAALAEAGIGSVVTRPR